MQPITTILLFLISASALAEIPHSFEAGKPARAAQVNENFNSLDQRIEKIESIATPFVPTTEYIVSYNPINSNTGDLVTLGSYSVDKYEGGTTYYRDGEAVQPVEDIPRLYAQYVILQDGIYSANIKYGDVALDGTYGNEALFLSAIASLDPDAVVRVDTYSHSETVYVTIPIVENTIDYQGKLYTLQMPSYRSGFVAGAEDGLGKHISRQTITAGERNLYIDKYCGFDTPDGDDLGTHVEVACDYTASTMFGDIPIRLNFGVYGFGVSDGIGVNDVSSLDLTELQLLDLLVDYISITVEDIQP